jgi:hypothetical protein
MKRPELLIGVDLGLGKGAATGLDLRPDASLYRHQRRLPLLTRRTR